MKRKRLIEDKLNNLIKLLLTSGVQPSELADNVFLSDYKFIKFFKQNHSIIGELTFEEIIGNKSTDIILRYFYDSSKKVVQIEEEIYGEITLLWSRESKEAELINEIVNLLKELDLNKVSEFISSLPTELSNKIKRELQKVA
ncbi:hypothetical protein [Neobacillus niacini]|uniref:hypothetical protein n=1 Tax=Neobacillus niacini TaxID=86668 RepID=UPI0021CB6962|nr:hypothetical protein [Neobacillus niacini]MCM3768374.1 hypothetical protein [Neobacillus niacini]